MTIHLDDVIKSSVVSNSPPPRKTDILFGAGEDSGANACVNYGWPDVAYRKGYRRGASQLAVQILETKTDQDLLIYPLIYLYRHHVELVLKSIVAVASILLDRELSKTEKKAIKDHCLNKLWAAARPLLNSVCEKISNPVFPLEDLEGIDAYIWQIHKLDPRSTSFRYSNKNSSSESSLPEDLKIINIRNFTCALEKLADYLDGIESWFSHLADQKAKMLS
jgi:hypothetical protein